MMVVHVMAWVEVGGWGVTEGHTATIRRSAGSFPRQQAKLAQVGHLLILVTAALPENAGSLRMLGWVVVRHIEG